MVNIPGSDAVKFMGNEHDQAGMGSPSGIRLDSRTEVENGETMDQVQMAKGGKRDYFFSAEQAPDGRPWAEKHQEILSNEALSEGEREAQIQELARQQEEYFRGDNAADQVAQAGGIKRYNTGGGMMISHMPHAMGFSGPSTGGGMIVSKGMPNLPVKPRVRALPAPTPKLPAPTPKAGLPALPKGTVAKGVGWGKKLKNFFTAAPNPATLAAQLVFTPQGGTGGLGEYSQGDDLVAAGHIGGDIHTNYVVGPKGISRIQKQDVTGEITGTPGKWYEAGTPTFEEEAAPEKPLKPKARKRDAAPARIEPRKAGPIEQDLELPEMGQVAMPDFQKRDLKKPYTTAELALEKMGQVDPAKLRQLGIDAAQFIPAYMASKDKPDYMKAPEGPEKFALDRVRYNKERTANVSAFNKVTKALENSATGPAAASNLLAAHANKLKAGLDIASAEAKENKAREIAENQANLANMERYKQNLMRVDEFNRAADAATKDRKLSAIDTAVKQLGMLEERRLQTEAQKRLAQAIGRDGVDARRRYFEEAVGKGMSEQEALDYAAQMVPTQNFYDGTLTTAELLGTEKKEKKKKGGLRRLKK